MKRIHVTLVLAALLLGACSDDTSQNESSGTGGTGGDGASGTSATGGTSGTGASGGAGGESGTSSSAGAGGESGDGASGDGASGESASGSGGMDASDGGRDAMLPSYEDAKALIEEYAAAHPGMDGDVNFKTPAELAADPQAQQIRDLCGEDARPVIPMLAWEYGGNDHAWMSPEEAALIYCVYTPVSPDSEHWQYDAAEDHVTADVYVLYPEDNPCKDEVGAEQIAACVGNDTNFEIIVDLASLDDGHGAGLELSEASTELMLVLPGGEKVSLWIDA